jgi:hypothetical protein
MHDFQSVLLVALGLPYSIVRVNSVKGLRRVMDKNKQRAVSILLFFGGLLVLWASWEFPRNLSPQMK